jgi:hypothetical protein
MENTTPISTRALLLVLENLNNNPELDAKLPSVIKTKGADRKCKMESVDSRIPKKPKGGLDQQILHALQEAWRATQESQYM